MYVDDLKYQVGWIIELLWKIFVSTLDGNTLDEVRNVKK